jgi:hypothetical protein
MSLLLADAGQKHYMDASLLHANWVAHFCHTTMAFLFAHF